MERWCSYKSNIGRVRTDLITLKLYITIALITCMSASLTTDGYYGGGNEDDLTHSLERPSMPRYHHTLSTVSSNNCKNSSGIYASVLTLSSPTMVPCNGAHHKSMLILVHSVEQLGLPLRWLPRVSTPID